MKIVFHISAGLLLVFLVSCGTSRDELREQASGTLRYRVVAFEKYGEGTEFVFNDNKTAVLCVKKSKPTAQYPQRQLSFFVFDLSMDSTIFEDNIPNGSVVWKDSLTVLVSTVPGTVKSDEFSAGKESGYIFDLRSRTTKGIGAVDVQ